MAVTQAEREYAVALGRRLRTARRSAGCTLFDFALELGVHENTLRAWEAGKRVPNAFHLMRAKQFLKGQKERRRRFDPIYGEGAREPLGRLASQ